jgi:hypothetical protein
MLEGVEQEDVQVVILIGKEVMEGMDRLLLPIQIPVLI